MQVASCLGAQTEQHWFLTTISCLLIASLETIMESASPAVKKCKHAALLGMKKTRGRFGIAPRSAPHVNRLGPISAISCFVQTLHLEALVDIFLQRLS